MAAIPNMKTESENVYPLSGTKDNPARDPRKPAKDGRGSVGDRALMDAVIIVAVAWLFLLFLAYSLRHHNI